VERSSAIRTWITVEKLRLSKFSQRASTQQPDTTSRVSTPDGNQAEFGVYQNISCNSDSCEFQTLSIKDAQKIMTQQISQ
jgi:hypothetical protein